MQVKEIHLFVHGPFATDIYIDAGQLNSIDDHFLSQFIKEKNVRIRDPRKQSMRDRTRKPNSSLFSSIERTNTGLRFGLEDFAQTMGSDKYQFENNALYFYESGTGMFSTQLTITFQQEQNILLLKESEKVACKIIEERLQNEIQNYNKVFSEIISYKELRRAHGLASGYFKPGRLAWLHTVYFLNNGDFFEDDIHGISGQLKDEICRELSALLEQIPEDMSPSVDRYIFYGWGRSLIVTKPSVIQDDVIRLVRLLEDFQYFCFGLYQLDTFLTNEMYNLDSDRNNQDNFGSDVERQMEMLRSKIQRLENIRSSTIRYLEQFRYNANVVFVSGERKLTEKLEDQWGLEDIEKGIRNKLDLFDRDLSSQERALLAKHQALIAAKQDLFTGEQRYLNKLILALTAISLGGAIAQVVVLSPLNDMFPERAQDFLKSQLFLTLIATGLLSAAILVIYTQTLRKLHFYTRIKRGNMSKLNKNA